MMEGVQCLFPRITQHLVFHRLHLLPVELQDAKVAVDNGIEQLVSQVIGAAMARGGFLMSDRLTDRIKDIAGNSLLGRDNEFSRDNQTDLLPNNLVLLA